MLSSISLSIYDLAYLTAQAYDRLTEKRSKIANEAKKAVDEYIRTAFGTDPTPIAKWCRYAKRPNGPLFWEDPTPEECKVEREHADYIVRRYCLACSFLFRNVS